MIRPLLLLLLAGLASLPGYRAHAQEKPVLNSAPPGPPPAQPQQVQPAPAPAPASEATPAPEPPTPASQPTPDAPSGLNFPNRGSHSAEAVDLPTTKKFVYSNFGLGFSSSGGLNQFNISGAPSLGFRLTKHLAVGPGISYAYSSFSVPDNSRYVLTANGGKSISTSSVGLKAFAQYVVYKEFFIHAEYEVTNAELIDQDANNYFYKYHRTVSTPLAGLGYRSYISQNAAFDIVALYNFDNTLYSLYPGLVVRFSFLFNIGH
ncbi:MAG: hypothetical protein NVS3B25_04350 [Hymenobacter sp.]